MSTDPMARFVTDLRDEADRTDFTHLATGAMPGAAPGVMSRLRTRVAAVAATSVLSVGAVGGVALAADGAAPGDFLYGIDRALEAVGLGNGGIAERLAEAQRLEARGEHRASLEHAADVVAGDPGAQQALVRAAEQVTAGSPVGEQVASLLRYMAQNTGDIDGAEVARLAQEIRTQAGPPEGTPAGPPEQTGTTMQSQQQTGTTTQSQRQTGTTMQSQQQTGSGGGRHGSTTTVAP